MNTKRENKGVIIPASILILDIEGTTSSISFVKDVLFPYVRSHLETYIEKHWDTENFKELLKALKTQAQEDETNKLDGLIKFPESEEKDVLKKAIIDNILWQMDNDRKTKSLKDLQAVVMEDGFKKEDLKGHVYDDVEPCLKDWCQQDKQVYIYSSGSVHAQKLLFGHSLKGDLLPFIKGHFDTSVGMKGDPESYKKILSEISCNPGEVAFFTDVPKEAKAAKEAGIFSILLSREGNLPLTDDDTKEFPVIYSFVEIEFEHINKKRKICSDNDVNNENKTITKCEVVSLKEDDKPNYPQLTANNGSEVMDVEECSEELQSMQSDENKVNVSVSKNSTEQNCDNEAAITDDVKGESLNETSDKPVSPNLITQCDNIEKQNIESMENKTPDALELAETNSKTESQADKVGKPQNNKEDEQSINIKANSTETNEITARNNINLDVSVDKEVTSKDALDNSGKEDKSSQNLKGNSELPVNNESKVTKEVNNSEENPSKNKTEVPVECDSSIKPESTEITETKETSNGIDCQNVDISVEHKSSVQETCDTTETIEKSNDEDCLIKTNENQASNTLNNLEINQVNGSSKANSLDLEKKPDQAEENSVATANPDKLPKELDENDDVTNNKEPTNGLNNSEGESNKNGIEENIPDSNPELNPKQKVDSKEKIPEQPEEKESSVSNTSKICTEPEKEEVTSTESVEGENNDEKVKALETGVSNDNANSGPVVDISSETNDLNKNGDNSEQPQSDDKESKVSKLITNGKLTNEENSTVNGTSSPIHNGKSIETKKVDDSNKSQIKTVVED